MPATMDSQIPSDSYRPYEGSSTARTIPPRDSSDGVSMPYCLSQRVNISRGQKSQLQEIEKLVSDPKAQDKGFLWLLNIPEDTFNELQSSRSTKHLRYLYISDERKLRIRMPHTAHEGLITLIRGIVDHKLTSADVLWNTCLPNGSPKITFGNITAEPDGCWGPHNTRNKHRTVILEVGNSETATELRNDARHWIEHPESSVQICLLVKLNKNPDSITLSVWRRHDNPRSGPVLRSHRTSAYSAIMTDSVTITRSTPQHMVTFDNPSSLAVHPTDIRLPLTVFTGQILPVTGNNDITLSQHDMLALGRRFWLPAYTD